jgi:hypothetical protein
MSTQRRLAHGALPQVGRSAAAFSIRRVYRTAMKSDILADPAWGACQWGNYRKWKRSTRASALTRDGHTSRPFVPLSATAGPSQGLFSSSITGVGIDGKQIEGALSEASSKQRLNESRIYPHDTPRAAQGSVPTGVASSDLAQKGSDPYCMQWCCVITRFQRYFASRPFGKGCIQPGLQLFGFRETFLAFPRALGSVGTCDNGCVHAKCGLPEPKSRRHLHLVRRIRRLLRL